MENVTEAASLEAGPGAAAGDSTARIAVMEAAATRTAHATFFISIVDEMRVFEWMD